MIMESKSIFFNLPQTLKYQKDGDFAESAQIEMCPPTFHTYEQSIKLTQFLTKALMEKMLVFKDFSKDLEDSEVKPEIVKEEETEGMDVTQVKIMLLSSSVNFMDILDAFIKVARLTCFVDEERKVCLTKSLIEKINNPQVITDMVSTYIANFCSPSGL